MVSKIRARMVDQIAAVSYTHLDVYKRQDHIRKEREEKAKKQDAADADKE